MAQIHIGAQVIDAKRFWSLTSQQSNEFYARLRDIGIKAIIARDPPKDAEVNSCRIITGTTYHRFCVVRL